MTCNIASFTQVTSALSIGLTPIPISFSVAKSLAAVFVIDDSSADLTIQRAASARRAEGRAPLRVFSTPYNQGYSGNQRLGYLYAIARGFDIVVLLHGDGLYAPDYLPEILAEYSRSGSADAVYGSRFLRSRDAIKGRMPLYTFVGNRILTWLQNKILGTNLSEMHSGYRSYRTAALPGAAHSRPGRGRFRIASFHRSPRIVVCPGLEGPFRISDYHRGDSARFRRYSYESHLS